MTGRIPTVCMKTTSTSSARSDSGIFHDRAAELDDRELPVELADEAHRLDQHVRLADGFLMHSVAPSRSLPATLASKLSIFLSARRVVKRVSTS